MQLYRSDRRLREEHVAEALDNSLSKHNGVLPLHLAVGPGRNCVPGRRLELIPEDYYPEGPYGPGIARRFLAKPSPLPKSLLGKHFAHLAMMGRSHVYATDPLEAYALDDALTARPIFMVGAERWKRNRGPAYTVQYFDNGPDPRYRSHAGQMGMHQHPRRREAVFYPAERNKRPLPWSADCTAVGLLPSADPDSVRRCLRDWDRRCSEIRRLSNRKPITIGTGAHVNLLELHGPGAAATLEVQGSGPDGLLTVESGFDETWFVENRLGGEDGQPLPRGLMLQGTPEEMTFEQRIELVMNRLKLELQWSFVPTKYELPPIPIAYYGDDSSFGDALWTIYGLNSGEQSFSQQYFRLKPGRSARLRCGGYTVVHFLRGSGKFAGNHCRGFDNDDIRIGDELFDEWVVPYQTALDGEIDVAADQDSELVFVATFGPDAWPKDGQYGFPLPWWQEQN